MTVLHVHCVYVVYSKVYVPVVKSSCYQYVPQNWPGLANFQPATEIDQLQLTFFVLKIESGYILLCNMIEIHTYYL